MSVRPRRQAKEVQLQASRVAKAIIAGNIAALAVEVNQNGFDVNFHLVGVDYLSQDVHAPKIPLVMAAAQGQQATVRFLLESQADPNIQDRYGEFALGIASIHNHVDVVRELLRCDKLDVNLSNHVTGATALVAASQYAQHDGMKVLLEHSADVNYTSGTVTPLRIAAENGHARAVRILLSFGADPDFRTASGVTPLITACRYGYRDVVEELLLGGANVNSCFCEHNPTKKQFNPLVEAIDSVFVNEDDEIANLQLLYIFAWCTLRHDSRETGLQKLSTHVFHSKCVSHALSIRPTLSVWVERISSFHPIAIIALARLERVGALLLRRAKDWLDPTNTTLQHGLLVKMAASKKPMLQLLNVYGMPDVHRDTQICQRTLTLMQTLDGKTAKLHPNSENFHVFPQSVRTIVMTVLLIASKLSAITTTKVKTSPTLSPSPQPHPLPPPQQHPHHNGNTTTKQHHYQHHNDDNNNTQQHHHQHTDNNRTKQQHHHLHRRLRASDITADSNININTNTDDENNHLAHRQDLYKQHQLKQHQQQGLALPIELWFKIITFFRRVHWEPLNQT